MTPHAMQAPPLQGRGWGGAPSPEHKADLRENARIMRRQPTEPEKRLWRHLSNSQLNGFKFRRQTVIGTSIADFLCPQKALVVEVDGDTHRQDADAKRDAALAALGYRTLRFTNEDVMTNMQGVLERISAALAVTPDRWPHPNPSPEGEVLAGATHETMEQRC